MGSAFAKADQHKYDPQTKIHASQSVKYDLIGKLVAETKLTPQGDCTDSGRH